MSRATTIRRTVQERDDLVLQYLPLVRYVVARMPISIPASLCRDDLYSVGVIGLLHAATTYDPARGASFKTFAYTAVRGAILDEIRRHDPVPRGRRDRLRKIDRAVSELTGKLDRRPTLEEISVHLGINPSDFEEDLLALHTCRVLSLDDAPPDQESTSLASTIDAKAPSPFEGVVQGEQLTLLTKAIGELPETERNVIVLYHYENLFLKEIGQILGVTESRVSQILTKAMARLRHKLHMRPGDRDDA